MTENPFDRVPYHIQHAAWNEGANTMLDDVLDVIRDEVSVQVYLKLEALRKKVKE